METRANYALIGLFTLAVLASAIMFVTWFSGADKRGTRVVYKVVFTTSVSGLSRGAQVLFNGLKVGEVTSIDLMDDPGQVYAMIDVDRRTPVKVDTRARLEYQGLTGVASIALAGGTTGAANLQSTDGAPPLILAERSEFQNILETVQRLSGKTEAVLENVDKLISGNADNVGRMIGNLRTFSDALAANSDGLKDFMAGMSELGRAVKPVAENLEKLTRDLDERIVAIDPKAITTIVANFQDLSAKLNDSADPESIKQFLTGMADLGRAAKPIADDIQKLTKDLDERIAAVDPKAVSSIMANVQELSTKLNASADKVDSVLAGINNFLGAGDGKGDTKSMFADVGEAARSIRKLADNLDQRTKDLTASIGRFTGPGLRQYEALAADGRKTLEEINRTLRSLEKNPQQLIFGAKPKIPEYSGR
jgi:phospholipid/cholesterol/gamma-HCH transport system substrate-binding protein